jgi:hypothetical protein
MWEEGWPEGHVNPEWIKDNKKVVIIVIHHENYCTEILSRAFD